MHIITTPLQKVLDEVYDERSRQDAKWGADRHHPPFEWLAILGEEVGECNRAVLDGHFGGKGYEHLREELIQVAAVAVAFIESLDRNELKK